MANKVGVLAKFFQTKFYNTLIYSHGLLYTMQLDIITYCGSKFSFYWLPSYVALHAQLFDMVNVKYQQSKYTATDSDYLKCHALLTALHFPLETTSCYELAH